MTLSRAHCLRGPSRVCAELFIRSRANYVISGAGNATADRRATARARVHVLRWATQFYLHSSSAPSSFSFGTSRIETGDFVYFLSHRYALFYLVGGGQFASSVIPICDILEGIITSVTASATASVPSRYRLHFQDKTESFREAPNHFHFIQMALLRRWNISARA